MSDILYRLTLDSVLAERDALRAEAASAQVSYAILRTILTQGYTDATGDAKVASDVPLIDLARAVCDSLGTLRAERDAEAAGRDALRRRMETMPPWEVSDVPTDEEMHALRLRWAFGPERYQADADALIAAVFHLRNEVARFTAERDRAVSTASWWEALGRDIGAKADALQVILDGRTTPPTDKEIEAHAKVNGRWRAQTFGEFVADCMGPRMAAALRDNDREAGITRKWWATTEDSTLRAWPVVTPASRVICNLCHGTMATGCTCPTCDDCDQQAGKAANDPDTCYPATCPKHTRSAP